MKKKSFIPFITLLASVLAIPSCSGQSYFSVNCFELDNGKKLEYKNDEKVYSTKQHYVYKVEKPFSESPDTFEAWIKVPKNSEGGMIAGNYLFNFGTASDMTVDWGIDVFGRFRIVWGCKGLDYSFPNVYLNNDTWCHVALTRNPETNIFTFYLNGVKKGATYSFQRDATEPIQMVFGSDNRTWTAKAEPFNGNIREITMYHKTLTDEDVLADYLRGKGLNPDYKDECIGNWYLGDEWKNVIVENTANDNKAYLASQDKYVPIAETPEFDYTILGMPDIQTMVDFPLPRETWGSTNNYIPMMEWVRDNIDKEKMAFAVQVGDIVDDGSDELQWNRARAGFDLWEGRLPYSTCPGNHDYTDNCTTAPSSSRKLELYNKHLGVKDAEQFKEFKGTMENNGIENSYYCFETCGVKYCVINLELFPRKVAIRWAGRICEMYPDHRIIINTHYYNDYYNRVSDQSYTYWGPNNYKYFMVGSETNDGTDLYNGLIKRYKNIFMTLSGHFSVEDAFIRKDIGDNGNTIINVLIDEQCSNHWGSVSWSVDPIDAIMLMKFNEAKQEIYFRYYSPKYKGVFNVQNQFTVSFKNWNK